MNCEMAEKNLSAYLDDMLDPQLHQEVAAHLESCAICSEVVAEYRRFDALLAETPRVSPPPELRDRIFNSPELAAAVRQQAESGDSASTPASVPRAGRSPTRGSLPRWTRIALQSAAVFAIIVGSALLFKQGFFHSSPTTAGHTSTPVVGNITPTGIPLAAGSRVIYEHDGALWSALQSGPGVGQQLTPANIQVSAVWSVAPDRGMVAYAEAGTGRIHTIRSDGQSDRATSSFSALCTTSALCADRMPMLAWSPNGSYIAYQSTDGTLHVVNADGTNDRSLSSSKQGVITSLLWSSNSNQLAFVAVTSTGESISSFNFSSNRLIPVAASIDPANSTAIVQEMFWLPDKGHSVLTWTAWDATSRSLTGIFTSNLSANAATVRLTPTNLQLTAAGFTPTQGNGIWLVGAINQNGTSELATLAAEQPGLSITNAEPGAVITGIYWSPAGGTAALVSRNGQLFLAIDNGASLSPPYSDLSGVTGTPIWSPDGTHLATEVDQLILSLGVTNGSFTLPIRLLRAVQTTATISMLWSPDSQDIAIATQTGTYLTSSDGKLIKQIDAQNATGPFVWSVAG